MWRFIIWFVPVIVTTAVGYAVGAWGVGLGLAFVWLGFCVFRGTIIVKQQEFVVIERLGDFLAIYFSGWHVRVIGVDRVHARGDLLAKRLQLYAGDSASKIDFSDTSAPINASIWYQIGDPVDITRRSWDKVADAIRTWVYSYERPEERVAHLVDGELRPLFQRMTIEQANQDRDSVADIVMQAIVPEMSKLGAYTPSDKKRLVIEDIVVSDDVIKLRETALRGMKRAEEIENEAAGYWRAIKTIQDNLKVSVDDARRIYETQRGLDTIGKTKPNLTLIGKDFGGVLGTINLGDKH